MLKKAVCLLLYVFIFKCISAYGAVVADVTFDGSDALDGWELINLEESGGCMLSVENGSMRLDIGGEGQKLPFLQKNVQLTQGSFCADITICPTGENTALPFNGTSLNLSVNGTEFFRVQPDSLIRVRNGNEDLRMPSELEAGVQFHISADFDTDAKTYTVYVNGAPLSTEPFALNPSADYSGGITYFRLMFAGNSGAVYYADNIKIVKKSSEIQLIGCPFVGQTISATVGDEENNSVVWQIGENDEYTDVSEGKEYILQSADIGKNVRAYTYVGDKQVFSQSLSVKENGNLALGAAVTATNSLGGFGGEKLTDGNLTTRWASSKDENNVIKLDLGSELSFNKLRISEFEGRMKNYTISVSTDDINYTAVYTAENIPLGAMGAVTVVAFPAVSAQYVRIDIAQSHTAPTVYEIEVFNDLEQSPIIYNAKINGEISVGQTVFAVNEIYPESDAVYSYQWGYKDGEDFIPIDGETEPSYTVGEDMLGGIIGVIIRVGYTDSEFYFTKQVFSENAVQPPYEMPPYVRKITLSEVKAVGETLYFTYDYIDVNGDEETDSLYRLIISEDESFTDYTVAEEKHGTRSENISFEIKPEYADKYLKISVTPSSDREPKTGNECFSEYFIKPDGRPLCGNVYISCDDLLATGHYTYTHPNGYGEGTSIYKWLESDKINGEYKDTGITTRTLNCKAYNGKYIKFSVIVCDEKNGSLGEEVISSAFFIQPQKSENSGDGGGSGGGGGRVSTTLKADNALLKSPKTATKKTFDDISAHWAQADIEYLAGIGIINGVSEALFEPDRTMKRSEAATLFATAFEIKGSVLYRFNDVSDEDWYFDAATALASEKIMEGDGEYFYGDKNITRQEFAKIVCSLYLRSSKKASEAAPPCRFMDSEAIAPWAGEYIDLCVKKGFMLGVTEELFKPESFVTRAQAATILARLIRQGVQ